MKRLLSSGGFLFLFVVMACISITKTVCAQTVEREWLVLVYVSALNDRGLDGSARELINQLENEGSSDKVTVLVKYSMLDSGADRELIFPENTVTVLVQKDQKDPAVTSPVIDSSPVQDMASETSLYLFARKSILKYPSKKIMLLFFGKGEGWNGIGQDDLSREKMGVDVLAKTLSRIQKQTGKKIDLLVMDADSMQTAEVICELKDGAEVIIGSEEKGSRVGFRYDRIIRDVKADPAMDPKSLANTIVYYSENTVISAVLSERIPSFLLSIDRWVDAVTADPEAMKVAAEEAKKTFLLPLKDSRDLGEFIERVARALPEQHPAAKAGKELGHFIEKDLLLANHKTRPGSDPVKIISRPEYDRLCGLAIYLPELSYDSSGYERMAFAANSKWSDFLLALIALN